MRSSARPAFRSIRRSPLGRSIVKPTRVINILRAPGIREIIASPDYVYIGRPSIWGNPYYVTTDRTRDQAIDLFEQYLRSNELLLARLPELVGKTLGCYCVPRPCHGHVIVRLMHERELI